MQIINQNFDWTETKLVEDANNNLLFTYSRTTNVKNEQFFEVTLKSDQMIAASQTLVYHPEFHSFIKGYSNYFGSKGKVLNIGRWDPVDDDDIHFLQDNIESAPITPFYLATDINFDWENRLFYYAMDMANTTKNEIQSSDRIWSFNGYAHFESVGDGFEVACIMPANAGEWTSKTAFINPGQSVTYNNGAGTSYLFVTNGPVLINGVLELATDEIRKISSDSVIISVPENATSYATVIIRESDTVYE